MSRPTTLPGLLGALAASKGVASLAEALGTNPRTLHNWATNKSAMPAIEAGLLADLGGVPLLYTHPSLPSSYIASTHEGWLIFGARLGGWAQRSRYRGHVDGLVAADAAVLLCAREHGWPW